MASVISKSNKPDLKALYRLEFYRNKKNWKLSSDKAISRPQSSSVDQGILKGHIWNKTYDVDTKSEHEDDKPSVLDAAFIDEIPIDKTPSLQVVAQAISQPFEDIHMDGSSISAPEPLCGEFWSNQDSETLSQYGIQAQNCYPVSHEIPTNCLQELLCPRKWPIPLGEDLNKNKEIENLIVQKTDVNWASNELSEVTIWNSYPYPQKSSDIWRYLSSNATQKSPTVAQEFTCVDMPDLNEINSRYHQVSEPYLRALDNAYTVLENWNNLRSKSDADLEQAWQFQQAVGHNCEQNSNLTNYDAANYATDGSADESDVTTHLRAAENIAPRPHCFMDKCMATPEHISQYESGSLHRLTEACRRSEDWFMNHQPVSEQYQFGHNDSEEFIREAHRAPHSSENDPDETADYDYCSLNPECLPDLSARRVTSNIPHATSLLRAALRERLLRDHLRQIEDLEQFSSCIKELFAYDEILDGSHLPHLTAMLEMEEHKGSHIRITMGRPYRT